MRDVFAGKDLTHERIRFLLSLYLLLYTPLCVRIICDAKDADERTARISRAAQVILKPPVFAGLSTGGPGRGNEERGLDMIVVIKANANPEKQDQLINWLKAMGIGVHKSVGEYQTVLGLIGDTSKVDMDLIESLDIVESVKRVTETFKCCNRKFHPEDSVIRVGDVRIGGGHFAMIAGPCSVESEEQMETVAGLSSPILSS